MISKIAALALMLISCAAQEAKEDRLAQRAERLGRDPEGAVLSALDWLARHQDPDGGWRVTGFTERCAKGALCPTEGDSDYDTGATGLAVLAFLGAGYAPSFKEELASPSDPKKKWKPGETVRKGLERLRLLQGKDGGVGSRETKYVYSHAIATLALAEGAIASGTDEDKTAARKATEFLLDARNPGAAWRYTSKAGDNDTSVTGWCVLALDAATRGGFWKPAPAVKADILEWIKTTTAGDRTGYNNAGTGKVFVPGKNEGFMHHETMTAIAVLARHVLDPETEETEGIKHVLKDLPENKPDRIDGYYWFWGSYALQRIDGRAGARFKKWMGAANGALLDSQFIKGCTQGSWESSFDRWGFEGGRVAVTALNTLTLLAPAK